MNTLPVPYGMSTNGKMFVFIPRWIGDEVAVKSESLKRAKRMVSTPVFGWKQIWVWENGVKIQL